jgi:hypothetical protein
MRQALAGMLWSKQYFFCEVDKWLREHDVEPLRPPFRPVRNREWFHMISDHVISMPDKWGISLVCDLGSCLSHAGARPCRRRFCQAAARSVAYRAVPASDETDPGL